MINKEKLIKDIYRLEKKLGRRPRKRDDSSLYYLARKHFGS